MNSYFDELQMGKIGDKDNKPNLDSPAALKSTFELVAAIVDNGIKPNSGIKPAKVIKEAVQIKPVNTTEYNGIKQTTVIKEAVQIVPNPDNLALIKPIDARVWARTEFYRKSGIDGVYAACEWLHRLATEENWEDEDDSFSIESLLVQIPNGYRDRVLNEYNARAVDNESNALEWVCQLIVDDNWENVPAIVPPVKTNKGTKLAFEPLANHRCSVIAPLEPEPPIHTNEGFSIEYILTCVPYEHRKTVRDEFLSRYRKHGADSAKAWLRHLATKER